MRQRCEGFLLCVPGKCFRYIAVNSLQAEQDSVIALSVLLAQLLVQADRSLIECSSKEINENKS